jgi:flap endonuclease-1
MYKFCVDSNDNNVPLAIGNFKKKIVIIDAMNRIYKQTIGLLQQNEDDKNLHVESTFRFAVGLIKFGMLPIFVFDGKSPKEKSGTLTKRTNDKKIYQLKCEEIKDKYSIEYIKNYKKSYTISKEKINECKKVLDLLGICFVNSPEEADQQCAALAFHLKNNVAGVISDDLDVLMYGAEKLLKSFSFNNSITADKKTIEINKNKILSHLLTKANMIMIYADKPVLNNFSHENFIDFVILSGTTDYNIDQEKNSKIRGLSNKKLFEICVLNNFSIIEITDLLFDQDLIDSKENFMKSWINVRKIYLHPKVINPETIDYNLKSVNKVDLINFLCVEKNINETFVLSQLEKMEPNYKSLKVQYGRDSGFV